MFFVKKMLWNTEKERNERKREGKKVGKYVEFEFFPKFWDSGFFFFGGGGGVNSAVKVNATVFAQ